MELSYDKYERRFWLSLNVPFWLARLFDPYQDCVEDEEIYVSALEEYYLGRLTLESLIAGKNCEYTRVLPKDQE